MSSTRSSSKTRSKSREKVSVKEKEKPKKDSEKSKEAKPKSRLPVKEEKKSSSKKVSNKENSPVPVEKKTKKKEEKVQEIVEEEEYGYEDDFEDYSDDFEDDEEEEKEVKEEEEREEERETVPKPEKEEKKEIRESVVEKERADDRGNTDKPLPPQIPKHPIEDENETPLMRRLKSSQGQRPPPQREKEKKEKERTARLSSASQRKFSMDPSGSQNALNYGDWSGQDKRYRMLRELIGIESSTIHILDKAPVRDYDFYLEMFGEGGKTQVHTQTGDDDICEETQTEERENENKWTQHPAQDDFGWGSEAVSQQHSYGTEDNDLNIYKENHLQNSRLKEFLETAAQVIIELISSRHRQSDYIEMTHRSQLPFSMGYNSLQLGQIAKKLHCTFVTKPSHDDNVLLCVFYIIDSPAEDINNKSLLVEFYLDQTGPPQRLYQCESEVCSCAYSPDGTALFAGLSDGSSVAWDLLEPSSSYNDSLPWIDSKEDIALRIPSYDTSFLSSTFSQNSKTAACIHVCIVNKENDSTYQVACLDESSTVSIWSVLRDLSNTVSNLGVRPGARLAMGLTALLRPDPSVLGVSSSPTFLIANCMASNPSDPMQFIVGTDVGFMVSMRRTKGSGYNGPRLYKSKMHAHGEVVCLKFSPFDSLLMVAGLSTGCLSLHSLNKPSSLIILTPSHSSRKHVTSVEWSPCHPTVFYSIHSFSLLLTWDIAVGRSPLSECDLHSQTPHRVLTSFSWLEKASENEKTGIAYMALGLDNGEVQIHALEPLKSQIVQPKSVLDVVAVIKRMENSV